MPYSFRWVISPHQTQSFANLVKAALNSLMWWDSEGETSGSSYEKWPQWLVSLQICCLHGSYSSISALPGRYTVRECTIYHLTCRRWIEKTRRWEDSKFTFTRLLWGGIAGLPTVELWTQIRTGHPALHPNMKVPGPKKKKGVMCTSWYLASITTISKEIGNWKCIKTMIWNNLQYIFTSSSTQLRTQ